MWERLKVRMDPLKELPIRCAAPDFIGKRHSIGEMLPFMEKLL